MQSQGLPKTHSLRNICGPFDREFNRKFLGRRSTSLFSERKILMKLQAPLPMPAPNSIDLLPKIREIEKISKSSGRKLPRASKYGEVLSELELYLAKKMISNQSTKQLISKIEENTHRGEGKWLQEGHKAKYSQTDSNFYTPPALDSQIVAPSTISPNQTAYSPSKKWITDDEFRTKFDRFIVKPAQQEAVKLNDLLGAEKKEDSQRVIDKLGSDKQALQQIVKKMIQENNYDSQAEEMEHSASLRSRKSEKKEQEQRGIRWILQKCEDFQRKFKPRNPKLNL